LVETNFPHKQHAVRYATHICGGSIPDGMHPGDG
jgi:hypothetical protein